MEFRDSDDFGCADLNTETANNSGRNPLACSAAENKGWQDQVETGSQARSPMEINQQQKTTIVRSVPGGSDNIQDAYPLTPLQEGLLFHHLLNQRAGTYVLSQLLELQSRSQLDTLMNALQAVIDRHDVLRIAVLWENLPRPLQVVYRNARLWVEELTLEEDCDVSAQLTKQLDQQQRSWDLRRAPAVRLHVAADPSGTKWYALLHVHHVICDYGSLRNLVAEVVAYMRGHTENLPRPIAYREHVDRVLANAKVQDGEIFFRSKLGDVSEPTLPFGLTPAEGEGARVEEARHALDGNLSNRLRFQARKLGVSTARFFHAAWGLVLAHSSARDDVVFGTVLLANWQRRARNSRILGISVNTLPLRLRLGEVTAKELVEQTDRELGELLAYEQVPLVLAQRCSSLPPSTPLFSALLNFRHAPYQPEAEWASLEGVRLLAAPEARTNYPIALIVDDLRDAFVLIAQTDVRMDSRRILAYMETALGSLVEALEEAPDTRALALRILPETELRQIVEGFNETHSACSQDKLVHQLFEEQVERTPNAISVIYEGQSLTYVELNRLANQLARHLKAKDVGPDQLVAICVERSVEMVVGLIAILKAGGAYVPLDPNSPRDRLVYMLNNCAPKTLLTQASLRRRFADSLAEVIVLEDDWHRIVQRDASNLDSRALGLQPHHLAYVIYTSGSTGQPKGVMIDHRNITRLFGSTEQWFHFSDRDVWTLFHSFAFDFSVWELWGALLYGGRVVVVPFMTARSPLEFYRLLCEQGVTVLNQTPTAFAQLIDAQAQGPDECHSLRLVIFGGEALELHKLRPWIERNDINRSKLVNMYGITETTVHVTYHQLSEEEIVSGQSSPIGKPIPDLQLYLLDRRRQVVPIGVIGEIYVGGAGVARGYLNRPELMAERFIADPFRNASHARLYRSGDLGRWRADGTIEYLGRNDHQVKIRGFRIELGEVETQLAQHEQVKEAAVVARDVLGERRLVAYVVPRVLGAVPSAEALRKHLSVSLPDYMVPSAFVALESFPLTPNGKLERKALPPPEREAYASLHYEAPEGEVERGLAEIWQSLLQVERVGRRDNFFDLGGHSLLVLKLLYEVNQSFATTLRVTDVYKSPTLQELATRIHGGFTEDDFVELSLEATLDDTIRAISDHRCVPPRIVLLTGSTGFVGRFILAELLRGRDSTIYCLVRARSREQATSRLKAALVKWDLWSDEFERRLIAIPGDLRSPRLGLDETTYTILASEVDSIYHCATSMNHLESYAMAKSTNVGATGDLLRFATRIKLKQVNYISTLSVFSQEGTDKLRVVTEETAIDHERHSHSQGYAASKWVGEKIFMIASERSIPCNIFRVGLVWADTQKGRYDELQREYRVLKSSLLSGYGIKDYRFMMPPTPVDYVARSVVFLADRYCDGRGIFHISSSRRSIDGLFERCNQILETPLALKQLSEWIGELKRLHDEGWSLPVMPLIESAFATDEASFHEAQRSTGPRLTRFDCSKTHGELERAGIIAPEFTEELLRMCLEDMLSRDEELRQAIDAHRTPFVVPQPTPVIGLKHS